MPLEFSGKKAKSRQRRRENLPPPIETGASALKVPAASGSVEDLRARIANRAYVVYVERGYRHGCALEDWLDAEREILSRQLPA
jgi:hypothetical protein